MKRGLFVTFEGPDGSGKTTLINALKQKLASKISLRELNYSDVLTTREPGGQDNILAEKIRNILLDNKQLEIPAITEAYLFAASRSTHVVQTIKPALLDNKIVLCDRYLDSSIVYQGYVRKLGAELIRNINSAAIDTVVPDITFYLDLPPEMGLERIKKNDRATNRLDDEGIEFHQQVANYYKQHFDNSDSATRLDASLPIDELCDICLKLIQNFTGHNHE